MKVPSRKLAEWITLIGSAVIFLSLVTFLVWDIFNAPSRFIDVTAKPMLDEVKKINNRFILPIDVQNLGQRTLYSIRLQVEISDQKSSTKREVEFEYLGRSSKQRIYMYLSRNPQGLNILITPVYYYFN